MMVAHKLRRKTKITITTSAMVSSRVNCTSSTAARMVWVRSLMISILIAGGIAATSRGSVRLDLVDGLDDVGAGLLEDDEEDAALAVGPGGLLGVFRSGDGLADVANPQRAAVAIGDDDVVPVLRRGQLVVGVDRVGARLAVDIALRASTVVIAIWARTSSIDRPFATSFAGSIWIRTAGFCWPPMRDLRHAGDLADLLRKLGIDASLTVVSGSVSEVADSSRIGESAGLTLR